MVKLEQEMLQAVEKPARYTGGEWNAQPKDSAAVLCRIALAMADVYEVGMSNLGLKILFLRHPRLLAAVRTSHHEHAQHA